MAMGKSDSSVQQTKSRKKDRESLPTKVVVRRLPPLLTENTLKEELDGMPEYDYMRLVPPDYSLAPHVFSRAYINFNSFANALQFRNSYDGYIFSDGKGREHSIVVELAPFQGLPKENKRRKDPKCGTIFKDPDYETFMENLDKRVEPLPSAEVYLEAMESLKADKATADKSPLVEFLNKKRAQRNQSRQISMAMLENDRKLKRDKDGSKGSKTDQKSSSKETRKDRSEARGSKASQDRKSQESRRKDERKDKRGASARKNKYDNEVRDMKEARRDSRKDNQDRATSARSDTSKSNDDRFAKRDERRYKDERKDKDRRKYNEESTSKADDQKKQSRAGIVRDDEKKVRRQSIEAEDPSIIAFGKTVTAKDERKSEEKNAPEAATKNKDRNRAREQNEDSERRTKNRERPSMAVYRPPVARQDRGKPKDEKGGSDKSRVKSPENSRSPDKRDRTHDQRNYGKDRPRSRAKDVSTDGREAESGKDAIRSSDRDRKDKDYRNKEIRKDR
eukprot:gene11291-12472_t